MDHDSEPFWIDYDYDRSRASDGKSRYGAYVRQAMDLFRETWDGTYDSALPARFAQIAWRQATGPVMAPPFVCDRAPITDAALAIDYDTDARPLIAAVTLATSQPAALARGYDGERLWRGWPYERSFAAGDYPRQPYGDEVTRSSFALASVRLVFAIPVSHLPAPPLADPQPGDVEHLAREAVEAVVAELNRAITPVLTRLEGIRHV